MVYAMPWVLKSGQTIPQSTTMEVVRCGHLDMLIFLKHYGVMWNGPVIHLAAVENNKHYIVQWIENKFKFR
jgi:hypothetical protein